MSRTLLIAGFAAALSFTGAVQAGGDAEAGKAMAKSCAGCHGVKGEGVKPNPALAGMATGKFVEAMKDYKSGKRANAIMKGFAAPLSDQDMANLAAYYNAVK